MRHDMRDLLRVEEPVDLPGIDASATPGAPGDKARTLGELEKPGAELADLQETLYAEGTRRVLLILQGTDTSGKGGTIKHVVGQVSPLGVHIASFKKPTKEELAHHFLWRIRKRVPPPGGIGVFDRSHYEDVLVVRVHDLADWTGRYDEINAFERELTDDGVTLVKVCLHISKDEQKERLLARLDDPQKRWKFNPGDLDERARWDDYMAAYADALGRCSTPHAPWYVVPADRKWYRNWAVAQLLLATLRDLDPQFPAREDLDVEACRARLESED
jgi:PPK2 family polyphosphate:nucleotide phosphotransferase